MEIRIADLALILAMIGGLYYFRKHLQPTLPNVTQPTEAEPDPDGPVDGIIGMANPFF